MDKAANKKIKDIRLFTSAKANIDGEPLPIYISNTLAVRFAHRLAWKLWEKGVSLGDYTHLYIDYNSSVCEGAKGFSLRSIDRYHPWFRYYEYGIPDMDLDRVDLRFFVDSIKEILTSVCASSDIDIENIIENVYQNGENAEIEYKRKSDKELTAIITLRISDNGKYLPTVKVQKEGKIIASKNLPASTAPGALGALVISKHKVTLKPKTAMQYKNIPSTIIEF